MTDDTPRIVERECRTHGLTEFALERQRGKPVYRCKRCRSRRATERRSKLRKRIVEDFGGRCVICGYAKSTRALHFHHLDPSTKEFGISACRNIAEDKLRAEAEKCVLLCANCHAEVEDGLVDLSETLN